MAVGPDELWSGNHKSVNLECIPHQKSFKEGNWDGLNRKYGRPESFMPSSGLEELKHIFPLNKNEGMIKSKYSSK